MTLEQAIKSGQLDPQMTFSQKVWALCSRVPVGQVTTYGDIARALGSRGARAGGYALNRNPYAPEDPCHRVVGSNGALTGFAGGLPAKAQLLEEEGVTIEGNRADLSRRYTFDN